jgi:hypothetical protein
MCRPAPRKSIHTPLMFQPATACVGSPSAKSALPSKYGVSVTAKAVTGPAGDRGDWIGLR